MASEKVIVLSPIREDKFNSHLNDSEVWKKAYHPEEVTDEIRAKFHAWFRYTFKFEGLRPIMMTKMEAI